MKISLKLSRAGSFRARIGLLTLPYRPPAGYNESALPASKPGIRSRGRTEFVFMNITDNQVRNRILLVLFVGVLMAALDIAIVGPALPAIQTAFGIDERAVSW